MKKSYCVGRVSGQLLSKEESEIGRPCKVRRFNTELNASLFIERLKILCYDEVMQGKFFLDGPV